MTDFMFRNLNPDEIEVRVSEINESGFVRLLLYKNARCDMAILDETLTPMGWQREHCECKGNLFCRVGIKSDDEWIWKSDVGKESNFEAEKGEASDAFKRACTNWGIGRELYTAPEIMFWYQDKQGTQNGNANVRVNNNRKPQCYDRFKVAKIVIEAHQIKALAISNITTGKVVYVWQDEEWRILHEQQTKQQSKQKPARDNANPVQKVAEQWPETVIKEVESF